MGWNVRGRHWVLLACGLAAAGCAKSGDTDGSPAEGATAEQPQLPEGHPDISGQAAQAAAAAAPIVAEVLETMDAAGYTYARVDVEGDEAWLAGPETTLEVGGTVTIADAMPMRGFHSSSLDRTFELIYFVSGFSGETTAGPGAAGAAGPASPEGSTGTVLQATHAAGYTYVEVESGESTLWLAGPQTQVAEGDSISWSGGSMMYNFNSPSLERTFQEILFVGSLTVLR